MRLSICKWTNRRNLSYELKLLLGKFGAARSLVVGRTLVVVRPLDTGAAPRRGIFSVPTGPVRVRDLALACDPKACEPEMLRSSTDDIQLGATR